MLTYHARARLLGRLSALPEPVRAAILARAERAAASRPGRGCVRLCTLPHPIAAPDGSNGDTVVAIVRDGAVETLMLRRSGQTYVPPARTPFDWTASYR